MQNPDDSNVVDGEEPIEQVEQETSPATKKKEKKEKPLWLDAWQDRLAGVKAFSCQLELADVNGDNDSKLLIADSSKKLKIYSGTALVAEQLLLDSPLGIASFYMDYNEAKRRPAVAVAAGPYIFIYKNLRPYYKFTLPPVEINQIESDVWANLRNGKTTVQAAIEELENAKENGVILSSRSLDFLAIEDDQTNAKQQQFVNDHKNLPLVQQTVITAMIVLKKDKDDAGAVGCLVIGTENGRVLILDSTGSSIIRKVQLVSVPVFIVCTGLYDVDYRIVVACRNGNIYNIKNGDLQANVIELESQPCGLARVDKSIVVGTMSNVLHSFHIKGKKQYSIYLPASITNICALRMDTMRATKAAIVALSNGELRVYNGKTCINILQTDDIVTGIKFGKYGREDHSLILTFKSGTIQIKMLPRLASLEPSKTLNAGPPPEQDIPLKIPRKTKLYIDQTQREKEFGVEMHRVFQRDLCKLRLETARAYVKVLTDGQGPLSYTSGSSLRLTAHVQGLGPLFKIKLNIQNTGGKSLTALPIVFTFNQSIYKIAKPFLLIPLLVPSLVYNYEVSVDCIDENAGADVIRVYVCNPVSCIPIITAIVNMPLSDFLVNSE
eukprot:TRINITY_DN67408_c1_g1_i1.p1 TRINITY_DN67408_c1_g1~~TRINITY_DN67408_c1_g1_i1.p1  ORF type:complete len:609 (-),score=85.28 TRINITY_DN67408_c1_g1_i1:410-2236(-)